MERVIVFGNQLIGVEGVKILGEQPGMEVVLAVGCESETDRRSGYPSLKDYCQTVGIPFCQPERMDKEFLLMLKGLDPSFCFSLNYRSIFNNDFIKLPTKGFVNLHPSPLPRYRGPTPYFWALLNGEKEYGTTLHYIDQGIDTGDIISQAKFAIPDGITGFEFNSLVMQQGAELFKRSVEGIISGSNERVPQDHSQATYYGPFRESLRWIDWTDSQGKTLNRIKALTRPYSGAIAEVAGQKVTIWSAQSVQREKGQGFKGPGRIVEAQEGQFVVSTVEGYVLISNFQTEGESNELIRVGSRFTI